MEMVLMLLSILGAAHFVASHDFFGILSFVRNLIAKVPVLGSLWVQLISCPFCMGGASGGAFYMLTNLGSWSITELVVWVFGSAMLNNFAGAWLDKLTATNTAPPAPPSA